MASFKVSVFVRAPAGGKSRSAQQASILPRCWRCQTAGCSPLIHQYVTWPMAPAWAENYRFFMKVSYAR
ncbi:hypothetical protein D9M70_377370 [compost metagenome]